MNVPRSTQYKDNNKNAKLPEDMNSKNDQEKSLECAECKGLYLKRFSVCLSSQLN